MKTTLQLSDDLYREVKSVAALSGRSVTSVIEEALRSFLLQTSPVGRLPDLPVSAQVGGLRAEFLASGVDFDDTSELLAWLDSIDARLP